MEESPVGKWFPLNRAWFMEASASWEDSWFAPVMRLLCAMWPTGAALDNRDEMLARTAKVPLKTWMRIREETGLFWVVKDGKFTQPFLAAEFAVAMEKAAERSEKASKGGKAKQEKAKQRQAEELAAQAARSSAPSSASSTASSTPQALLQPHTRACEGELSSEEGSREDLRATAVPKPAYIEACFKAYPRERRGKNAANRAVPIPEDARVRIARFLLERPGYPLLEVFRAVAKTCDFPPALADFLAEPWDAESTLRAAGAGKAAPQGVFLDEEEARRAREAAEWESLTEADRAQVLKDAQELLDKTIGRKQA